MTTSFDPTSTATSLATASVQNLQQLLNSQNQTLQTNNQALTSLQSALSAFSTTLSGLSSLPGQSVTKYSAGLADTTLATASANSSAVPGSYSVQVQQLATQHAISFANVPATVVPTPPTAASTVTITLGNGQTATINLSATGGSMNAADIARAINQQSQGLATATVVSGTDSGGNPVTQLTLTSGVSGAQGAITSLDFADAGGSASGELVPGVSFASATQLTPAQDAKAVVNGVTVQQASNTLTAIPGVSLTLKATSATPTTLTVARDDSATASQVQSFVTAYNTLKKALDGLTAIGSDGTASGIFANDSGVRSLEDRLSGMLRQSFDGTSLMGLGVSADRSGNLSLDNSKLSKVLAAKPTALDDVFGNASLSSPSGLLGTMSSLVNRWTDSTTGQIQQRQASQTLIGKYLTDQQTRLTQQYNDAYGRYLAQFTQLQTLQAQMSQTLSMFD